MKNKLTDKQLLIETAGMLFATVQVLQSLDVSEIKITATREDGTEESVDLMIKLNTFLFNNAKRLGLRMSCK